jgi:hypothetical protein
MRDVLCPVRYARVVAIRPMRNYGYLDSKKQKLMAGARGGGAHTHFHSSRPFFLTLPFCTGDSHGRVQWRCRVASRPSSAGMWFFLALMLLFKELRYLSKQGGSSAD